MIRNSLTADYLRSVINYDAETGIFMWPADQPFVNQVTGKRAGGLNNKGYRMIEINAVAYPAHRLAWLYVTGVWPTTQIDHISREKDDNRFANLRLATDGENKRNNTVRKDSKSGFKCVNTVCRKHDIVYRAMVTSPGEKQRLVGTFINPIDAAVCANYNIAYTHGEFATINAIPDGAWCHD